MAGRYSYSSSPYDPMAAYQYQQMSMQSGPRRFFSAVGRFFYRVIVLCLVVGAIGGILFALYRNDVLLTIARGAGFEGQYRDLEKRFGAPGWGTPRSVDLPADPVEAALADQAAKASDGDSKGETVNAIATTEAKTSTPEGLPIVSLDSLPTAPAKGAPEPAAPETLPAVAPVKVARAEAPRAARATKPKAEAKPVEVKRSIPLIQPKPKPEPAPVAKAEPPPKPEPKPEPEPDRTAPRPGDNPLKAAIRAAMANKKSE